LTRGDNVALPKLEKRTKSLTIPSKWERRGLKFDPWDFGSYKMPSTFRKLRLTKKEKIIEHNEEFPQYNEEESLDEVFDEEE
jgi:hypothetical protein